MLSDFFRLIIYFAILLLLYFHLLYFRHLFSIAAASADTLMPLMIDFRC